MNASVDLFGLAPGEEESLNPLSGGAMNARRRGSGDNRRISGWVSIPFQAGR